MEKSNVQPFEVGEMVVTTEQMKSLNISDPAQVVAIAKQVDNYVRIQGLTVQIQNKPYVEVEGWQFAGSLFGLVSKVVSFENASQYAAPIEFTWSAQDWKTKQWVQKKHTARGLYKYFAEAHCVNSEGRVVGQGFALCSNEEVKKHTFDEYAILSMAQTRAIGKAYRMAIAFIIKAAGYEPTPAEEMETVEDQSAQAQDVSLSDKIEEEILMHTDADQLADWANKQKEFHKNSLFLSLVKNRITELSKPK